MTKALAKRFSWIAMILALSLVVAACGGDSDGSDTTEDGGTDTTQGEAATTTAATETTEASGENDLVTLRYSWIPDDIYLPVAIAKANGYYDEVGITVVDQTGNGGATAALLVANGDVMVGQGEASHVYNARAQGIPMVAILQQIQEQPAGVIALKESGIEDWDDLVGKRVGGTAASSSSLAFEVSLALQGIDSSEVEFVSLSPGANFAALQEGEVDAALTFLGNIASLPYRDDLNILPFGEAGFQAPSTAFFVTEEFLAANTDLMQRFVSATLKGLSAAIEDPQAAAEALASQQALIDVDDIVARWGINEQFILNETTDEHGLGYHNPDSWQFLIDTLVDQGEISEQLDSTEAYTNTLVEQAAVPAP
ncbi:MAG: ABC transporter substrate-binding protein [Acidimicrobiia bacterium]